MPSHNEIKAFAKRLGRDIEAGKTSGLGARTMEFMESAPQSVLAIADLVQREANRKKPDEATLQACVHMFSLGLQALRFQVDRGFGWAEELVDAVRERLLALAQQRLIPPHLLMLLLNGFIEAKLPPGDELTGVFGEMAREVAEDEDEPALTESGMWELLGSILEDAGGNAFEVHAALSEISQALPAEFRTSMLGRIAMADSPALRDTAVLYLLDPAPEVREAVCRAMTDGASSLLVSPAALRRMVALRNWLPAAERQRLDATIKNARQSGVECASWPPAKAEEIIASNLDGAGAQSVFAVAREGRRYAVASLLVKHGVGIADAWCLHDQSKSEVKEFLGHVYAETDCHDVEPEFLHRLVPHFLAVGQKNGHLPVAGMLDFLETAGIHEWQPSELSAESLLAILEQGVEPARLDRKAVARVTERSGDWPEELDILESWFEEDAAVDAVISGTSGSPVDAVIDSVLERRRAKWAEYFLWTALWLKQKQELPSPWREFLIIGRELHRGRPISEIPVMRRIAETTVTAKAAWS